MRNLPDIEELLEPLERAISDSLIPAITGHTRTPADVCEQGVRSGARDLHPVSVHHHRRYGGRV